VSLLKELISRKFDGGLYQHYSWGVDRTSIRSGLFLYLGVHCIGFGIFHFMDSTAPGSVREELTLAPNVLDSQQSSTFNVLDFLKSMIPTSLEIFCFLFFLYTSCISYNCHTFFFSLILNCHK
jgi:hypothetical protein